MAIVIASIVGYLSGSLSIAYLIGRLHGVDLRRSGSGNLGTTNVAEHFGARWAAAVLAGDFAKAFLPAFAAFMIAGRGAAAAAGIAAVAGHNWSAYLRFTGGRGLVCTAAALLVLSPPIAVACIVIMLCGYPFRQPALSTVAAALLGPILAVLIGADTPLLVLTLCLSAMVFAKRAQANGAPMPPNADPRHVLLLRMVFDRDIADDRAWQDRRSEQGSRQ